MHSVEQEFITLMYKFRKLKSLEKIMKSDLSLAEMTILDQIINYQDDITVSSLAETLKVSKAAISKLVSSIEQKGYIERKEDEKDKRITHISIKPNGKEIVLRNYECMEKHSKFMAEKMGEDDLTQLIVLMNKLYKILEDEKKARKD